MMQVHNTISNCVLHTHTQAMHDPIVNDWSCISMHKCVHVLVSGLHISCVIVENYFQHFHDFYVLDHVYVSCRIERKNGCICESFKVKLEFISILLATCIEPLIIYKRAEFGNLLGDAYFI